MIIVHYCQLDSRSAGDNRNNKSHQGTSRLFNAEGSVSCLNSRNVAERYLENGRSKFSEISATTNSPSGRYDGTIGLTISQWQRECDSLRVNRGNCAPELIETPAARDVCAHVRAIGRTRGADLVFSWNSPCACILNAIETTRT